MNHIVNQFCQVYTRFDEGMLAKLDDIYSVAAVFQDPAHRIEGRDNIHAYFRALMANLTSCDFEITNVMDQQGQAFLTWHMTFMHPQLKGGKTITIAGATHIQYSDKVDMHRDYFDMGAMVYEHLPVVGRIINYVKARMAS